MIALKGNASTGGTDFIALYVSNKLGRSIWSYVFVFNAGLLLIFGYMFGWEYAGYSILFQFISTKTIDSFYHRYERMTMQITTSCPEVVIRAYVKEYRHGISRVDGVKALSTVLYSEGVMSNDRRVIWKNLESDEEWNLILRRKKYN